MMNIKKKKNETLLINFLYYSAHTVQSVNVKRRVRTRIYTLKVHLADEAPPLSLLSLISKTNHASDEIFLTSSQRHR